MSQRKIAEALSVLEALGMLRAQRNERSALCLLALLNLTPDKDWCDAEAALMGITPMMEFVRSHYGRQYAPNTRETFRRQTIHQFLQAGLVLYNPDNPDRAVNSPKTVYQVGPVTLKLIRSLGSPQWQRSLTEYLSSRPTLAQRYADERQLRQVPVQMANGTHLQLSPGEHSDLIRAIIEEFAPRFLPGSLLVYAGDTGDKWGYFNQRLLVKLGVSIDRHGKMPDVLLYYGRRKWLALIECATSHGPVDAKRHDELSKVFATAKADLVYVTAFPSRTIMSRYLADIDWDTDVWVAESPSHLIHFNGPRFLGPYVV